VAAPLKTIGWPRALSAFRQDLYEIFTAVPSRLGGFDQDEGQTWLAFGRATSSIGIWLGSTIPGNEKIPAVAGIFLVAVGRLDLPTSRL
jgi:hypothetical protein